MATSRYLTRPRRSTAASRSATPCGSTRPSRRTSSSGTPRPSTSSTARLGRPAPRCCRSSPASRSASSPRSCRGTTRSSLSGLEAGRAWRPGNSVVLKPRRPIALSALRLGELALEAGLPEVSQRGHRCRGHHRSVPSPATRVWTRSRSPAPPRWGGRSCATSARPTVKGVSLEARRQDPAGRVERDVADPSRCAGRLGDRLGDLLQRGPTCNAAPGSSSSVASCATSSSPGSRPSAAQLVPGEPLDPATRPPGRPSTSDGSSPRSSAPSPLGREGAAAGSLGGHRVREETGRLLCRADHPGRRRQRDAGGPRGDLRAVLTVDRVR